MKTPMTMAAWCAGVLMALTGTIPPAAAQGNAAKGAAAAQVCTSCHGPHGVKTASATTPKLAAQIPQYIVKQLQDFKSGARKNAIMSSMAATVSDADMTDIAAYFAAQPMVPDSGSGSETGNKIYEGGVAATAVPACASCHSPRGAGVAPLYPRLAGQHAAYLVAQLKAFKTGQRANDPNAIMRDIASKLDDSQMQAVADYLATLQ